MQAKIKSLPSKIASHSSKVDQAIADIKFVADLSGARIPVMVMFSGGKDSLTVALLCKEAGITAELLFMESSIDLPGSVEKSVHYARELDLVLHRTNPVRDYQGDFSYWIRRKGYFPTVEHPWCSTQLKVRPSRHYMRRLWGFDAIYKLTGVRALESGRRRRIYRGRNLVEKDGEHSGSFMVHPILSWTDSDVDIFLAERGMLFDNALYSKVGVSGCFWCPFYQDSIIERIERTFPGIYDQVIEVEREVGKPSLRDKRYLRYVIERVRAQLPLF